MLTLAFISLVLGFILNNLVSKLKLKEKINVLKLQAYKDLLRAWVIYRNVVIGYMLVRETTEGLKRKMEVRLKLDEAHVSSSALISEICLYCKDKKLINYLVEINDLIFLENNWLNMNKKEIDEGLEKLKVQIFEIFSNLREEIEIS